MKFLFLLISLSSNSAFADQKLISFEAFVQFSEARNYILSHGGENTPIRYGSPLYEGTEVKLDKDATLKIVTRENCVVITYGEGEIIAPQAEKAWRIRTPAARFICPESTEEKFIFHGVEIISHGETLFDSSGKIFVVTGNANLPRSETLTSRRIYQYTKGKIESIKQDAQAQYDFDRTYRPPREAEKLQKPKALVPNKYRIAFGPLTGPAITLHPNGYLNHYDYSSNGPRLQLTFRDSSPGIILGLQYLETQSKNQNNFGGIAGTSDHLQGLGADVGYRFNFERWWSPFIRAGAIWTQNELSISSPSTTNCDGASCNGYFSDQIIHYFGLSATAGIDALLRPSWLGGVGLFASAEMELEQTVFATNSVFKNQPNGGVAPQAASNQEGFITNLNALLYFGVLFEF